MTKVTFGLSKAFDYQPGPKSKPHLDDQAQLDNLAEICIVAAELPNRTERSIKDVLHYVTVHLRLEGTNWMDNETWYCWYKSLYPP